MNAQLRKFPIGIQTFENIRREGYVYVDKTALIYRLVTTGKPYFLSRPRRFGKSLLLSTLESYFEGRRELFEGLAIADLEEAWQEYPVLHLDLNAEKYDAPEQLGGILNRHLNQWEDRWGREEREESFSDRFSGIIRRACEQTGQPVVVLVDEYDKPLLQALQDSFLLEEYRKTLKAFYGVLKSSDRYLRFVFLTGVTKFSQVSVFSDLNQLTDISMLPQYATLCGLTHGELERDFNPEIGRLEEQEGVDREEILRRLTRMYDGYHFSENTEGVFNPFSLLHVLQYSRFDSYWFQTGTPTFLVELLQHSDYDLRELIEGIEVKASGFSEYRADSGNPVPLLYQSGYLTIKSYDSRFRNYTLCFPNEEVEYGFMNFLVPFYTQVTDDRTGFYIERFIRELEAGDVDGFMERLRAFFAGIPYELNDKTERHYQVIFYIVFTLMGQFCDAEVRSSRGRADAVVKTGNYIYIFEFKLGGSADAALEQIDSRGYLIPYTADGRTLVRAGVSFDAAARNIGEWKVKQ